MNIPYAIDQKSLSSESHSQIIEASFDSFDHLSPYKKRILIVDDQGFNIDALMIILKFSIGLDSDTICEKALNGIEALDKVILDVSQNNYCSYELILMDCNMPFMDGYEATQKIREFLYENKLR